jgi:dephospho-CoA kinase
VVIGVAGKYCAGKDRVIQFFHRYADFDEVDVDKLGHRALKAKKDEIAARFGDGVLDGKGGVDRKKLSALVFKSREALDRLERIVHPYMKEEVSRFIESRKERHVIVNAALLFYMGLDAYCDAAVWVRAPFWSRLKRAVERDGISFREAVRRFRAQRKLKPQQMKKDVDIYTIRNSGSLRKLDEKAAEILKKEGIL